MRAILSLLAFLIFTAYAKAARPVNCERFGGAADRPLLILLHGASGPGAFPREQAEFFAHHGFRVLLPHYFKAGHGTAATDANYEAWVAAIRQVLTEAEAAKPSAIVLVGYSLGASVALALGSQGQGPDAIAEFYGSLPDRYFRDAQGMAPLLILHGGLDKEIPVGNALQLSRLCVEADWRCETHIYPAEGHGFSRESMEDADRRVLRYFNKTLGLGGSHE